MTNKTKTQMMKEMRELEDYEVYNHYMNWLSEQNKKVVTREYNKLVIRDASGGLSE